jgi:hypothetical protein
VLYGWAKLSGEKSDVRHRNDRVTLAQIIQTND